MQLRHAVAEKAEGPPPDETGGKSSQPSVICLVFVEHTPGAFCGLEAGEGQGETIARNLFEMSDLKVPDSDDCNREGGSGSALCLLAVANEVWMMMENSVYSVCPPEGFASILWKRTWGPMKRPKVMKMTTKDLYELGLIERIIAGSAGYSGGTQK